MNIHKRTRLTPLDREEIWRLYGTREWTVVTLSQRLRVSRPMIYKVIDIERESRDCLPGNRPTNAFCKQTKYGMKRLTKIESSLDTKKKLAARRYNKNYPGEMIHFDTKRLPLLKGEINTLPRDYLFVGIDDFSRELYAAILPDKTQNSAATFLEQVIAECPYIIECAYSDNGTKYKGTLDHAFVALCKTSSIGQKFTCVRRPQTNGKAERVIRAYSEIQRSVMRCQVKILV